MSDDFYLIEKVAEIYRERSVLDITKSKEIIQLVRDSEWQPIGTAPKDGSLIQLYRPEIEFVGYYSDLKRWVVNAPNLPAMFPSPTHWKPLSPPSTNGDN